ncbi:MAG: type VI secretion system membrane subunit TssM [Deltaproteobacteria bacterium]|nr:type VI secretion system membrane subunit TssM [Deltaproteobacteria bacterium]
MVYVFLLLLAIGAWALWFILQLSVWIPLCVTVVLALVAGGLYGFVWWRARSGASALERAIAQQANQQLASANLEKRAEIQQLQQQIGAGIQALKQSKLAGRRRGLSALYSLPWYAIIGPPGAGKTTALKHSGLVFPYADSSVRGVGGTRNCDWWFTNEAILLDTAGRYSTGHEDQAEWIAFLRLLRRHRGAKPLNGLIVAVAIPDIIDATEQQIEHMGKTLRARIDEVMTELRMVLPVYVLITKSDLIAGFCEFFGGLKKSERAQAWGATLRLGEDKTQPGVLFQRELDVLVGEIHARAIKRLAQERDRGARELIHQFPLEFAGIRRNLSDLLATVFMVNAFQGTPLLRGVYFTSGTQEGTPLGRVLSRMGQAMGIAAPQLLAAQRKEPKSYFLHDVFMNIVFPDADVAGRSASELRRQQLVRVGVSAAALVVAVIMAVPSTVSFAANRSLLKDTGRRATESSAIEWENASVPVTEKSKAIGPVFGGKYIHDVAGLNYVVLGIVAGIPCKYKLELTLKDAKGADYLQERLALKTYLMLSDVENLDVEWATGRLTVLWADLHAAASDVAAAELRRRAQPLIAYYLQLLKDKKVTPVPPNEKLVTRVRAVLGDVPVRRRFYAQFVEVLIHEKYDPAGDNSRSNRKFPPVTLEAMFTDRPEVLRLLTSKTFKREKKWLDVPGPYTDKGHVAVLSYVDDGLAILQSEAWVVPLTPEERGDRVAVNLARVSEDYELQYVDAWKKFLEDLEVEPPANLREATKLFDVLKTPEIPYLRVLRRLEDHTQWKKNPFENEKQADKAAKLINRKINQKLSSKTKGLRWGVDVRKLEGKVSAIPNTFRKTVAFGVPQDQAAGPAGAPLGETPLAQYVALLGELREKMLDALDRDPEAGYQLVGQDLQVALRQSKALLEPFDDTARTALLPLLQNPFNIGGKLLRGPMPQYGFGKR